MGEFLDWVLEWPSPFFWGSLVGMAQMFFFLLFWGWRPPSDGVPGGEI